MGKRQKKQAEKTRMETYTRNGKFFTESGFTHEGVEFGDPYRPKPNTIAQEFFGQDPEEPGEPSFDLLSEARELVESGKAHPNSPAAQLFHAWKFSRGTSDHYPTYTYWR